MLINKDLNIYRPLVDEAVKDLHALVSEIGHEDLKKTTNDLRNRVNEPFMFVIVGEVKAGKSSFINALLETDKEICKVSPAPMTDTIQQILFGETEQVVTVNPFLKKLYYPIEILREIAIVDTPGTNTIVAKRLPKILFLLATLSSLFLNVKIPTVSRLGNFLILYTPIGAKKSFLSYNKKTSCLPMT
jgi:hypothetical protein